MDVRILFYFGDDVLVVLANSFGCGRSFNLCGFFFFLILRSTYAFIKVSSLSNIISQKQ